MVAVLIAALIEAGNVLAAEAVLTQQSKRGIVFYAKVKALLRITAWSFARRFGTPRGYRPRLLPNEQTQNPTAMETADGETAAKAYAPKSPLRTI